LIEAQRRWVTAVAVIIGLIMGSPSASPAASPKDPSALADLYGGDIDFQILRDGKPVGYQTVRFSVDKDRLTVKTISDIAVEILFVTVYHFHYESESRWEAGLLQAMTATTSDGGKVTETTLRREGKLMSVDGPAGHFDVPAPIFVGEHWDIDEVRQDTIFNSITGKLDRVSIVNEGPDQVPTPSGPRAATRYVYSGDLRLTAWYDAAGRWVGLRFAAKDGSTIDYRCRRCGVEPHAG
jgi:hypothetical protein